jgi:hypothetical protein
MPANAEIEAAATAPPQESSLPQRSFVQRWKHKNLFERGFLVVPTLFLHHYAHLKPTPLTTGEAMFVLHLMEFKWDAKAPFPGYKTIAARMGVSDKMARRYAQSLETKKFLHREVRRGQTNLFDLTPLFDALSKAVEQTQRRAATGTRKANKAYRETILAWTQKMLDSYRTLDDAEKQELHDWEHAHVDGSGRVGTTDWPGWEKHIGKKPE